MHPLFLGVFHVLKIAILLSCLIGCGSVKSPDATSDASITMNVAYDIAYIYEFTITPDITDANAFLLVINRGAEPLALSTARVAFVDVDSGARLGFTKTTDSNHMLAQGRSAGQLSQEAMTKLVTSGLTTEPIDDSRLDFTINFLSLPPSGLEFHGKVVLEIAALKLELPFTIHVDANAEPSLTAAQRLSARATP